MMLNTRTICDSTMMTDYNNIMFIGNYNNLVSSSTGVFPALTDFAGELNFQIILKEDDSVKNKWLFSEKLRKVFIDIDKSIGIQFYWRDAKLEKPSIKFIRALPVYTQDDWLRIPVERCPMHIKHHKDQMNIDFQCVNHVVRCENEGTQYEIDSESRRRSCITPVTLNKENPGPATLFYKFVCKTSCYQGTQRRPVVVIFTLEDELRNVLGRQCLSFKVCSCLKRDLNREENGLRKRKNRKLSTPTPEYVNLAPDVSGSLSPLPSIINTSNSEVLVPCTFKLLRLKKEYAMFALKIMHNTLLGELVRNNVTGIDVLLTQIEKLLHRFYYNRGRGPSLLQS